MRALNVFGGLAALGGLVMAIFAWATANDCSSGFCQTNGGAIVAGFAFLKLGLYAVMLWAFGLAIAFLREIATNTAPAAPALQEDLS